MSKLLHRLKSKKKPAFIIAEVGQNHCGSIKLAHEYIDTVSLTGADAIKFQTHYADEESTYNDKFRKKINSKAKTRYEYWKSMEFTESQWRELKSHCDKNKIMFLSSPFSIKAARVLKKIKMQAWKIGSGEFFNSDLLAEVCLYNQPIILSTGMSTLSEISSLVRNIRKKNNKIILLQCTSRYPSDHKNIGINVLDKLKKLAPFIGLSDHSGKVFPSLSAISLGANMIEVHVALDKKADGPDISSSLSIPELKLIVDYANYHKLLLTNPVDKNILGPGMKKMRDLFSRSLALKRDFKKGHVLLDDDIILKKPGTGIQPSMKSKVIGKALTRNVNKNYLLKTKDIEF